MTAIEKVKIDKTQLGLSKTVEININADKTIPVTLFRYPWIACREGRNYTHRASRWYHWQVCTAKCETKCDAYEVLVEEVFDGKLPITKVRVPRPGSAGWFLAMYGEDA